VHDRDEGVGAALGRCAGERVFVGVVAVLGATGGDDTFPIPTTVERGVTELGRRRR
jgi:hypothetical protein